MQNFFLFLFFWTKGANIECQSNRINTYITHLDDQSILTSSYALHPLCGEKPTTVLPPTHDRVLIPSVHRKEGLFTDISVVNVFVKKRERDRESESRVRGD